MWLRASFISLALGALLTSGAAAASDRVTVRVDFDRARVTTNILEGMRHRGSGEKVTIRDPVRIASVSKLFVALGVMRLVDQGKLDLDADVSDVLGWRVRNPAFPDKVITLRLLLSHQSSLSDAADYIIPVGDTLEAKLADPKAWDAKHAPGSGWFSYTNLNFPLIASIMERRTGERFDGLMRRLVFTPLRLEACFNWSGCSTSSLKRAITLYRANGEVARDDLGGKPPACWGVAGPDGACDLSAYRPGNNGGIFGPQGGLRISAQDLAKTGQMLLRKGRGFLSAKSFATLTNPAWRYDGTNGEGEEGQANGGFFCAYGMAVQTIGLGGKACNDDGFGDGRARIGHAGEAYGLKSGLWADLAAGRGTAFFVTAVPDDEARGRSAFYRIEEAVITRR